MHTSGLKANILYTESAMCSDGSIFTDKDVHRILRRKGFRQMNEGCDRNEWFNCSVDDVKAAIVELKTGIVTDASRTATFKMRPEQYQAVKRTMEYYAYAAKEDPGRPPKFLWNAKMRLQSSSTSCPSLLMTAALCARSAHRMSWISLWPVLPLLCLQRDGSLHCSLMWITRPFVYF